MKKMQEESYANGRGIMSNIYEEDVKKIVYEMNRSIALRENRIGAVNGKTGRELLNELYFTWT